MLLKFHRCEALSNEISFITRASYYIEYCSRMLFLKDVSRVTLRDIFMWFLKAQVLTTFNQHNQNVTQIYSEMTSHLILIIFSTEQQETLG
jgi:hypothetical protein